VNEARLALPRVDAMNTLVPRLGIGLVPPAMNLVETDALAFRECQPPADRVAVDA
jgi:hypothetical protein